MAKGKKTAAAPKAAAPKTEDAKKGSGRFSFSSRVVPLARKAMMVEISLGEKQRDCNSCTHVFLHVMFHHRGRCLRTWYLGTDLWHSSYQSFLPGCENLVSWARKFSRVLFNVRVGGERTLVNTRHMAHLVNFHRLGSRHMARCCFGIWIPI